ncbi:hypothetical protein DFH09DRAFT_1367897 [Mycena vulgaris]|nr:hypothetical protein DFH09DRAFT_1367897 [Mycena vulgaris]
MSSSAETTNALSHAERSRLVRSNRKLQALLGEAPHIIVAAVETARKHSPDSQDPHAPAHIRAQSDGRPSSASSSTLRRIPPSPLTLEHSAWPHLSLHLHSPGTHKHSFSLGSPPLTPLSPTLSMTLNSISSPLSSAFARSLTAKESRRRRVAKLTRTLGENIAPELIAGHPPPAARLLRRATSNVWTAAAERPAVARAKSTVALHTAFASPTLSTSPRAAAFKSQTLGRSFSTTARGSRSVGAPHSRGESVASSATAVAANLLAAKEVRDVKGQQLETAVMRLAAEVQAGKRRKEKGWSGEWNHEMEAVVKQLRSLK